mmetsp:Transcript_71242/g.134223  ORF Transcript_71242/g.134223 Transcript_71242/m.134223 type:complete len:216 (-) Transcript_71242:1166-1813(-)
MSWAGSAVARRRRALTAPCARRACTGPTLVPVWLPAHSSAACVACLMSDLTPLATIAKGSPARGASGVGLKERHTNKPSAAVEGGAERFVKSDDEDNARVWGEARGGASNAGGKGGEWSGAEGGAGAVKPWTASWNPTKASSAVVVFLFVSAAAAALKEGRLLLLAPPAFFFFACPPFFLAVPSSLSTIFLAPSRSSPPPSSSLRSPVGSLRCAL